MLRGSYSDDPGVSFESWNKMDLFRQMNAITNDTDMRSMITHRSVQNQAGGDAAALDDFTALMGITSAADVQTLMHWLASTCSGRCSESYTHIPYLVSGKSPLIRIDVLPAADESISTILQLSIVDRAC